jgi:hypothetical protein
MLDRFSKKVGTWHPTWELENDLVHREWAFNGQARFKPVFCSMKGVGVESYAGGFAAHDETSDAAVDRFSHATISSSGGEVWMNESTLAWTSGS